MSDEPTIPTVLGCALLGLLARRSLTGYAMARLMERPVGYFWTAGHSQIYPELARLEGAGLVDHEVVEGAGPRDTKRYAVTAAGRAALTAWLVAPPAPVPQRDLEVLRVWSLWTLDHGEAHALVTSIRTRHESALADLAEQHAEVLADPRSRDHTDPQFASLLTLEGGMRSHDASIGWCDWMSARLDLRDAVS